MTTSSSTIYLLPPPNQAYIDPRTGSPTQVFYQFLNQFNKINSVIDKSANVTGNLFTAKGKTSGFQINRRDTLAPAWIWYANSSVLQLYSFALGATILTVDPGGGQPTLAFNYNNPGRTQIVAQNFNSSGGSNAAAEFQATSNTVNFQMGATCSGFTAFGILQPSNAFLYSAQTIVYIADGGASHVFAGNGGAQLAKLDLNGFISIKPIGYGPSGAGVGGTVTQNTSKSTGVTLSTVSGQITMNAAALAASTTVTFTLTNTIIAATDLLVLNHVSGGTAGSYTLNAQAAAGSASINVRNVSLGSLSEAIVIGFAVIKAVTS